MTHSANTTKNYTNTNGRAQMESGCSALTATPVLFCPWASVAGSGRKTVTPTAEVRIVALPERWARCLLDNSATTVVERLLDQARVWKLDKCPLRSQTLISFSVPSEDSVAPPCHGQAAVDDCLPRRGQQHLGTILSASKLACRTSKITAGIRHAWGHSCSSKDLRAEPSRP